MWEGGDMIDEINAEEADFRAHREWSRYLRPENNLETCAVCEGGFAAVADDFVSSGESPRRVPVCPGCQWEADDAT